MKQLPYYEPSKSIKEQISHSSSKRKQSKLVFLFKKIKNHSLESVALHNPINSIRVWCHRKRGVKIGKGVMIGMGCVLDHAFPQYIVLENNTALAGNVYILTHSNPYKHFECILDSYVAPVIVKEGAWIGINATILPGVIIGKNSVIGAGVVVSKSVPDNTLVTQQKFKMIKLYSEDKE